jgi:outer membrane protein OmpA-like peptidoglycan-associated protein
MPSPLRLLLACALALASACSTSPLPGAAAARPASAGTGAVTPTLRSVDSDADLAAQRARLAARLGNALEADTMGYYLDVQTARLQSLYREGVAIRRAADHIRLVIPGADSFDTDSTVLTPAMQARLDDLASLLLEYDQSLALIAGHSDNQGNPEYNRRLSRDRAQAVGRYLNKRGVEAQRLLVRGFGDTRPVADNATPEGRAANRRIELELWPLTLP